MRIAQVPYLFWPAIGGVETHVLRLSLALKRLGHEVHVLTSDQQSLTGGSLGPGPGEVEGLPFYRHQGIHRHRTRIYAQPIWFPGVIRSLWRGGYDLIHLHSVASLHFDLAWMVSRLQGIPLVVTGHSSPHDLDRLYSKRRPCGRKPSRLLYWQYALAPRLRQTGVIAIVPSEAEKYREYLGCQNLAVIPNGIDPQELEAHREGSFRQDHQLQGKRILLYLGRIAHQKGLDLLAQATAPLLALDPQLHLVIMGPVGDQQTLDQAQKELRGVQDQVLWRLSPTRPEAIQALWAADCHCLPSRGEVFGIVLAEAAYCETPSVSTLTGGIPEVFTHGQEILLTPPQPLPLGQAIQKILYQPQFGQDLALRAKERVLAQYTWERVAQLTQVFYEKQVKV